MRVEGINSQEVVNQKIVQMIESRVHSVTLDWDANNEAVVIRSAVMCMRIRTMPKVSDPTTHELVLDLM